MIKPLVILFNTFFVFLFSFFFGDSPVSITGIFPKNVKSGTEFTAELKISKIGVSGFSKLQIEVPLGFTIKEQDSKGGSFSFANNIGKIIWTASPNEPEFTVKFTLITDATVVGVKTIASKYSYVNNNNVKEFVEMVPAEIIIGGEAVNAETTSIVQATQSVTAVNTTSVNEVGAKFTNDGSLSEPSSSVSCIRTITKGVTGNQFNVQVNIKKPGIKGFAKFQEILPAGFTMKSIATNGSSFSIADGKGKFVWVSLPIEDNLLISYTLEGGPSSNITVSLDGEFSYLEHDQTKKIKLTMDVLPQVNEAVAANAVADNLQKKNEIKENAQKTEIAAGNTTQNKTLIEDKTLPNTTEPAASIEKKNGNIAYHIQIGAFSNAIESTILAKKFNLSVSITSEMTEGYHKFMVGTFSEYKEARNDRETIKEKGCRSAFVVAYNGTKRITVQEALMITNQKWFK